MLSKKQQGASIKDLKDYLKKERRNPLSLKKRKEILDLIKEKKVKNKMFAEKMINSPLYRLACIQLKREGKSERVLIGEVKHFENKPIDIIVTMDKIVRTIFKEDIV